MNLVSPLSQCGLVTTLFHFVLYYLLLAETFIYNLFPPNEGVANIFLPPEPLKQFIFTNISMKYLPLSPLLSPKAA